MKLLNLFRHFTAEQEKNRQAQVDEKTAQKEAEIKAAGISIFEETQRIKAARKVTELTSPLLNKKKSG